MLRACQSQPEDPALTARDWIARLGGEAMRERSWVVTPAFAAGHFRFRPLEEEIEAPSLPFHYISLTLNGMIRVEANVGGRRVNVKIRTGQSMIMSAGRDNRWRWDAPTEEAFVFLRPDFLHSFADEAGTPEVEIRDRFVFEDAHLRRTLHGIASELSLPGALSPLYLDMAAQAVAARLLSRHRSGAVPDSATRAGQTSLTAPQLRRVLSLVEDRLGEEIDLAALADAAGVSRFHFLRCFRATTGMSPHRWVTGLRIARACRLLEESRHSVLEIAGLVGFESQSHFGQVFRRVTGLAPRDWRAERRGH